jgi:ribokinase
MSNVVVVGSYVEDLTFWNETLPARGETRISHGFKTGQGGKGFNQAVACNRQGIATLFVGAIGSQGGAVDSFGQDVQRFARHEGHLATAFHIDPEHPTGAAAIAVDATGHNQISVYLGANDHLPVSHIVRLEEKIQEADILLCQLESNLEATEKALSLARHSGVYTILNPAPINEGFDPKLLNSVDVLTPNESEFLFLLKKMGHNAESKYTPENLARAAAGSSEALAAICREIPVRTVIITLGDHGAFVFDRPHSFYVPAIQVKTLDTTGAGDAFSGGLAAGLILHDYHVPKAVRYATAVAALSTTAKGTSPSMPYSHEVQDLLKNSGD